MKVEGRFITLLFVTIGFILILSVSITKGSRINPDSASPRNQRSITVSTSPAPKLFSVPSSDGKPFEEDGVGKDDESDGKEEDEEDEEPFPDEGKEGEVNGGESGEESEDEDEEEEGDVDGTSSSSEEEEKDDEKRKEEEGSSSENTDGSSSDISSTSKSSSSSSDGRVVSSSTSKKRSKEEDASKEKSNSNKKKYSFTNCSIDNLNLCSRSLLFYGDPNLIDIPETPLQVARKCNDWRSSVKCSFDWRKKCLMGPAKLLVGTMINGPSKDVREKCSYDGTLWFLRSQRCMAIIKPEVETCLTTLKNGLSSILTMHGNQSNWESSGCCLFQQFNTCFDIKLKEGCLQNEGLVSFSRDAEEESAKYIRRVRDTNFGTLMNQFCAKEKKVGTETSSTEDILPSSSSVEEKCEELITKLSQITNTPSSVPISSSSSSKSSIITDFKGEEGKENSRIGDRSNIKKLMMSQKGFMNDDSLIVTVIKLYQKFGKISNRDIIHPLL